MMNKILLLGVLTLDFFVEVSMLSSKSSNNQKCIPNTTKDTVARVFNIH